MRGSGTWLATALLGLALVLGTQAPAAAAADQPALSVSGDGVHWTAGLDRSLVRPAQRWVPGDSTTVSVWVQNLSTREARLEVGLVSDDDPWIAGDLQLSAAVGGRRLTVRPGPAGVAVGSGPGSGVAPLTGPTRIDLTVAMPRWATNRAQHLGSAFALRVALVDAGAAPTGGVPGVAGLSEPVAGHLPDGTPPFGLPLTVIALAVAARAAHLALRRRHVQEVMP